MITKPQSKYLHLCGTTLGKYKRNQQQRKNVGTSLSYKELISRISQNSTNFIKNKTLIHSFKTYKKIIHLIHSGMNKWLAEPLHIQNQFSSVAQLGLALCDPMDCSTLGLPVHHQLPEFAQTPVHGVGDVIQPSRSLSSPSPALSLSQHQGLFQWVSSSHQVAKALELQLQHQSFQWIFRVNFL